MVAACVTASDAALNETEADVRIACQYREVTAAFRLVHDAYVRDGLMRANEYRMRVTPYHLQPTTEVCVSLRRGEVISTVTLVKDGKLGLPMETIFGSEVNSRRLCGAHVGEASCLASVRHDDKQDIRPALRVFRLILQCARRRGINELMIAVHPHHAGFYERFMGFERIGSERMYEAVCGLPAVPLMVNLDQLSVRYPRVWKRFFGAALPDSILRRRRIADHLRDRLRSVMVTDSYATSDGASTFAQLKSA
jgi:hypothetical protein